MSETQIFEAQRPTMLGLAYRMLGDLGRAEEVVQTAWLRWRGRSAEIASPRAFLCKVVSNLCLNELASARSRREEGSGPGLPEPIDLRATALDRIEILDRVSMAFLVALQRLTAAERAVLLLHEVFDFSHAEVAEILGRTEASSRQLLRRAKAGLASERRSFAVEHAEHRRLLGAFLQAAAQGDADALVAILADDATLIADAGPEGGRFGRARNLPAPLVGARKIAAFVAATSPRGAADSSVVLRDLNGQPAALVSRAGRPYSIIQISVVDGRIARVFVHADPRKLAAADRMG
jgi:RNA polymerase sigma-70 factor (ECF subfamily)